LIFFRARFTSTQIPQILTKFQLYSTLSTKIAQHLLKRKRNGKIFQKLSKWNSHYQTQQCSCSRRRTQLETLQTEKTKNHS
jgi:hypothetical protein